MSTPSAGKFGSRIGFILAAAGSAIGLGNIWRFPYTAGESGGGAFVLAYLAFVLLIGIPVLMAELSLGRKSGSNAVGAFRAIVPDSAWRYVGGLGVLTGFGILAFYSVVAGWTLSYAWDAAMGTFADGMSVEASGKHFGEVTAGTTGPVVFAGAFLVLTALVVRGGVSGGIERASKILMPLFFVVLVILVGRSLTLEGASKGVEFLFSPDFSKLTPLVLMNALGQALFSLSLGMGAMITYGGYLQKDENLPVAGISVAIFDTLIAILAGLIIFPALFTVGAEPSGGPGLVFVVLPTIFDKLPAGQFFSVAFYSLLGIAALTSTISLLEVVVAYFVGERDWPRERAVWVVTAGIFLLAIPSALSMGAVEALSENAETGAKSFLDWQSIIWGNVALSIGAAGIAVFVGHKWGAKAALAEMRNMPMGGAWEALIKYVCPLAIVAVLVYLVATGNWL